MQATPALKWGNKAGNSCVDLAKQPALPLHLLASKCELIPLISAITNVTTILQAIEKGDSKAASELLPLVYEELRQLATRRLAHEDPGQTLQPTALVHEA